MPTRRQHSVVQIAATAGLIAVLLPVWYTLDFLAERKLHQYIMWEQLEKANLQTIIVDSATLRWEKPGKEIVVGNEFFDVASIRFLLGKAIVTGIFDEREKALHEAFAHHQKNNRQQEQQTLSLVQWLQQAWFEPESGLNFHWHPATQPPPVSRLWIVAPAPYLPQQAPPPDLKLA